MNMKYVFISISVVFFYKRKTEYARRISDWRSDVCSSDVAVEVGQHPAIDEQGAPARDAEFGRIEHLRQILGIEAERLDDEIGGLDEGVARIGLGRAPAARVGRPQQIGRAHV